MGSFVGFHVESRDEQTVLEAVSAWLTPFGFGAPEPYRMVPKALRTTRIRNADAVGLERLDAAWQLVSFNSHSLDGKDLADAVRPLMMRLTTRAALVSAQTTSDVYQLSVFDGGQCIRSVLSLEGVLATSSGSPLPGERPGAFAPLANESGDDDAPSVMDDLRAICAELGFQLWRAPPLQGPGHCWQKRSLLRRLLGR